MIKEILLFILILTTLQGQYFNEHPFSYMLSYDMGKNQAESLSANAFGNRLLVGGGNSGRIYLLDIEDLNEIETIEKLKLDDSLPYIADLAHKRAGMHPDGLDALVEIRVNVTDVLYLTGGRYALASLSFKSNDLPRHPLLKHGAIIMLDMVSFEIKSLHFTDPRPEHIATSWDNRYILLACQGYEDDFQDSLTTSGTIMKFELVGADLVYSSHFAFSDQTEALIRKTYACPLGHVKYEPENVICSPNELKALVTLQKCSSVLELDIESSLITGVINLKHTTHYADVKNDKIINFDTKTPLALEPDGITYTANGSAFFTANEGKSCDPIALEKISGGRNITGYKLNGTLIYDSLHRTEVNEALTGLYKDQTSTSHGSQLEDITSALIGSKEYIAVTAEQSGVVHFFDISQIDETKYLGHVPVLGKRPEDIVYIPKHKVFITANEKSKTISIIKYEPRGEE